jgi:peroxiredoxin
VGAEAPGFELLDHRGNPHSLRAHLEEARIGQRKLWVAFFRYASCPLCNLRVHRTIERFGDWPGLTLLAIWQSTPATMHKHVGNQNPPFPMLCDPDESVYARYGLEASVRGYLAPSNAAALARAATKGYRPSGDMDGTKTRLPADFFIDAEGILRRCFYAKTIAEHIPFEEVDTFASS